MKLSVAALLLANTVPLFGVLLFDWQVLDVMLLYWAENVVIGVVNVLRMLVMRPGVAGFFLVPFFVVHYGAFCYAHYTAVVSLFGATLAEPDARHPFTSVPLAEIWQSPLWAGVVAISISHLLSFFVNFLGRDEHRRINLMQLMQRPYGRIVVLHIAVIAGGFLVTALSDPLWMLLALVVIKSMMDLKLHQKERSLFS